jgi:hypothetical protein
MRITAVLVVACLATAPVLLTAADTPAPTVPAAPAVAVPPVNMAFAAKALDTAEVVSKACQTNLDTAKAAAQLPFAGDKAKKKVESAQGALDVSNGIKTDLSAVAAGKAPAADGVLAQIAASQLAPKEGEKPSPSPLDKLKKIPGAETVVNVLSTPGVAGALVQSLPLDKVPGYSTAAQALGLAAP